MKRQGNLSDLEKQARIAVEMKNDDEIMFQSEYNEERPSRPIYNHFIDNPKNGETLAGPGISDEQNQDDTTDAENRTSVVSPKREQRNVKIDQQNNERQNNENDINAQNTHSITVTITCPSKF